jgi:hypothetical protein
VCYDLLEPECPIMQGDIFYPLPSAEISLTNMQVLKKVSSREMSVTVSNWDNLQGENNIIISAALQKTWGIVATQNCDASRIPDISLFQIESYLNVNKTPPPESSHNSWINIITDRSCKNVSLFYLPVDERLGISNRMVVNFHKVFHLPRLDLVNNIKLRRGRLTKVAYEHYRECIAQYYRRYPYNEWYSLNREEAAFYVSKGRCKEDDLYLWQGNTK